MFKSQTRLTELTLAAGFLSFGAAWAFAPEALLHLFAAPGAALPVLVLGTTAFAMHSIAAGLFALFGRFKSWTFIGYAVSMLPVFAGDYWLYAKSGAFNEMILLHATGMGVMVLLCVHAFRMMRREERLAEMAV